MHLDHFMNTFIQQEQKENCALFLQQAGPKYRFKYCIIAGGIYVRTCACTRWHFDKFPFFTAGTPAETSNHIRLDLPSINNAQGFIFLLWPPKSLSQSCWSWNEDPPPTSICFHSSSLPIILSGRYIFRETTRISARRESFILVAKYPKRQMPCLTPLARTSPDVMDLWKQASLAGWICEKWNRTKPMMASMHSRVVVWRDFQDFPIFHTSVCLCVCVGVGVWGCVLGHVCKWER